MRKLTLIILALGVIFIFQCCATSEQEIPVPEGLLLSQSEVEQLYKNECTCDYYNMGASGTVTTFPNGTQKINWKSVYSGGSDTGTYRIVNGQKCDEWDNTPGETKCSKIYKIGEKNYKFVSDDEIISEVTFK